MTNYATAAWRKHSAKVRFIDSDGSCSDCGEKPEPKLLDATHNHYQPEKPVKPRCRSCHAKFDAPWRRHAIMMNRARKNKQLNLFLYENNYRIND